jgi:amino acid transporter
LVTAAVYAVATIAVIGIVPLATLQDSTSPFAEAATSMFGGAMWGKVFAGVVMISMFGALNGWILLQGACRSPRRAMACSPRRSGG